MWNKRHQMSEDDDESWEVRAFEEDTTCNIMGCTWPPRSYTCTFCRREFRSAQALGGHMNVHRRDRARMHHSTSPRPPSPSGLNKVQASPSTLLVPGQDLIPNGLCFLYTVPNPNGGVLIPTPINRTVDSFSPFLSSVLPSFTPDKPTDFPSGVVHSVVSSLCQSSNTELSNNNDKNMPIDNEDSAIEELDLELRLGRKSPPPQR